MDLYGEGWVAAATNMGAGPEFISEIINITGDHYLVVYFSATEYSPYLI